MKFKAYSSVLLTAVFLIALSMPSQAATIAGTKCTKVGTIKTVSNVKYVCVKSGTKLIWKKGTDIKATPTPKASVSTTPTPSQSATVKPSASATPTPSQSATPKASVSTTPTPSQSATQIPSPTKTATPSATIALTKLTSEEVKKHDSGTSCWSIVYGNVFDLTKWIPKHPGGPAVIRAICGKDGTSAFEGQHAGQGKPASQLSNYYLGKLGDSV
jgi:cytochrome b involved in lipid metabolism